MQMPFRWHTELISILFFSWSITTLSSRRIYRYEPSRCMVQTQKMGTVIEQPCPNKIIRSINGGGTETWTNHHHQAKYLICRLMEKPMWKSLATKLLQVWAKDYVQIREKHQCLGRTPETGGAVSIGYLPSHYYRCDTSLI